MWTRDLHLGHLICACPLISAKRRLHLVPSVRVPGQRTSSRISTVSFLHFYRFKIATASVVCFLWNLGYFINYIVPMINNYLKCDTCNNINCNKIKIWTAPYKNTKRTKGKIHRNSYCNHFDPTWNFCNI